MPPQASSASNSILCLQHQSFAKLSVGQRERKKQALLRCGLETNSTRHNRKTERNKANKQENEKFSNKIELISSWKIYVKVRSKNKRHPLICSR